MTNIRELLATNIKTFRNQLGLTQAKLAERAKTATHYIAMIEGCKNFPSPEMIDRIAIGLEKDPADLFSTESVKQNWKESILLDIGLLIDKHLEDLKTNSKI